MTWNDQYERYSKIWGDSPSELAVMVVSYLRNKTIKTESLTILDVACGYGRDTFYLHHKLGCRVTGIDISSNAIEIANSSLSDAHNGFVQFIRNNFMEFLLLKFDILFISKLYHLLDQQERNLFLKKVKENLNPNGLLFLSTHSIRDPQLYGKGIPHPSEPDSFYYNKIYRHFSSAKTLQKEFNFLEIKKLFEHEYLESREDGYPHHHISWMLTGKRLQKNIIILSEKGSAK